MIQNVYFFTGENLQELEEKLHFWKKEFIKKHTESNLETFEELTEQNLSDILNALESAPFLAEKRMVIIKNFPFAADVKKKAETEVLKSALEQLPDSTLAIFVSARPDKRSRFYKLLSTKAKMEEFPLLQGRDLIPWIQQRFQRSQKTISSRTAEMLAFYCGEDMNVIAQEIRKLSLLQTPAIEDATIETFVSAQPEAKIFKVLDMVGNVSPSRLLKEFSQLVSSGEDLMMIFYMIVRQIRLLVQVRYLKDRQATRDLIQKRLKIAPFQAAPLMKQADAFTFETLRKAYDRLAALEYEIKTGKLPTGAGQEGLLQLRIDQFLCSLYE